MLSMCNQWFLCRWFQIMQQRCTSQHARGVVSTWFLSPSLEQGRSEEVNSLSRVWLFVTPWTVAYQPPPSMEFSRQAYWSGLPFPSPGDLPDPGIEPRSPTLQADTLPSEPPGNLRKHYRHIHYIGSKASIPTISTTVQYYIRGKLAKTVKWEKSVRGIRMSNREVKTSNYL